MLNAPRKSQIFLVWVLSLLFLASGIEHFGLPWCFSSKESARNARDARDAGSIPGLGKCPGGGHGNALQHSCRENPVDRGAWQVTVHRIAKSRTRLKQLSKHAHALNTSLSLSPHFLDLYNRVGTTFQSVIMITQDFVHTGKAIIPVWSPPSLYFSVLSSNQHTSNLGHAFSHTCDLHTSQTLHTIIKTIYYLPCTVASALHTLANSSSKGIKWILIPYTPILQWRNWSLEGSETFWPSYNA